MSEAWSAYFVPESHHDRLFAACKAVFGGVFGLRETTLIVGDAIGGFLPFVVEYSTVPTLDDDWVGEHMTHAGDHDLDAAELLSGRLGGQVVSMYGTSNTDSLSISVADRGRTIERVETDFGSLNELKRLGLDLDALKSWGDFGISGAEPNGLRYPLEGDGTLDVAQRVQLAVLAATTPELREAALKLVRSLADGGRLDHFVAATHFLSLGKPVLALGYADGAPRPTFWQDRSFVRICLEAGAPEKAANFVADSRIPSEQRVALLKALGRHAEARQQELEHFVVHADWFLKNVNDAFERAQGPSERVQRLDTLAVQSPKSPGLELAFRFLRAREALALGEAMPNGLLDEMDGTGMDWFVTRAETLRGLVARAALDPLEALRADIQNAEEAQDEEALARAYGELGLALFYAKDDAAGGHLEDAYIRLGTNSPYRSKVEAALKALGLF
jgi:hypothetical protein